MTKINGWIKLDSLRDSPILGATSWKNEYTGEIVMVDRVRGGGGVVYLYKSGISKNLLGEGTGMRTKALATKKAISLLRSHPRGFSVEIRKPLYQAVL